MAKQRITDVKTDIPSWETDSRYCRARSIYDTGYCHETGIGIIKDTEEAAKCYRRAAFMGYPPAQNALGFMHATGRGVASNDEMAVEWFRKAADADHGGAHMNLGVMYAEGRGVQRDDLEALCCFYKAAICGNAEAQTYLAHALENGLFGLAKDADEAAFWLEQAKLSVNH